MEFLKALFHFFTGHYFDSVSRNKMDLISELPIEISHTILRMLDPETLLSVPQVSRKWHEVCSSDSYLKEKARNYLALLAQAREEAEWEDVDDYDEEEDELSEFEFEFQERWSEEDLLLLNNGNIENPGYQVCPGCPVCARENVRVSIVATYRVFVRGLRIPNSLLPRLF